MVSVDVKHHVYLHYLPRAPRSCPGLVKIRVYVPPAEIALPAVATVSLALWPRQHVCLVGFLFYRWLFSSLHANNYIHRLHTARLHARHCAYLSFLSPCGYSHFHKIANILSVPSVFSVDLRFFIRLRPGDCWHRKLH